MIAKYIYRYEYQCKCCSALPPDYDEPYDEEFAILFDSFARIRERWGAPLNITSGYRCPRHNAFIGGHPLSIHQWGLALDIGVEPHQVDSLHNIIEEVTPDLRVGEYSNYIHVDIGWAIHPRASEVWQKQYRWRG